MFNYLAANWMNDKMLITYRVKCFNFTPQLTSLLVISFKNNKHLMYIDL